MRNVIPTRRWLFIVLVILLAIGLGPSRSSAGEEEKTFCRQCAESCTNDAWAVMMQCYSNGGTTSQCNAQYNSTLNSCNAVFCNYGGNCNLPTNY